MTRIEKINSYYEKNMAELERIHGILNNSLDKNVNADNYKILGWESRQAQYARFAAFLKNVDLEGKSLLDVGCGLGDLYHFLTTGFNKSVKYVGIDISEKMIQIAKSQLDILKKNGVVLPEGNLSTVQFVNADIFSKDEFICRDKSFDWLYSSGIFNLNLGNNLEFLENAFNRFSKIAKEGFCCSMLNVRSKDKESPYFYYSPEEVFTLAKKNGAKDVLIVDDYLENDFTIVAKL